MNHLTFKKIILFFALVSFVQCGSNSLGGTDTGNSEIDTSNLSSRFASISSTLVPIINATSDEVESNQTPDSLALTYQPDSDWDLFLMSDAAVSDIFGSPNVGSATITKIQVILNNVSSSLESVFNDDPNISCTNASSLTPTTTIDLPFFGQLDNGSIDNPRFDCHFVENDQITIYGEDADNVIRWALMDDGILPNTEQVAERGNFFRASQIFYLEYGEVLDLDNNRIVALSLQYAQITTYSGPDDVFDSQDDIVFKSRSFIVGQSQIDEANQPSLTNGDFIITKAGRYLNEADETITQSTTTMGRGSYGEGEVSIFRIYSDESESLENAQGYFCLEHSNDQDPQATAEEECLSYETNFSWQDFDFPFDLNSDIKMDFEEMEFFENTDTDLIADDGSNFDLPNYNLE